MTETAYQAKTLLLLTHNIDARRKKMNKKLLNICKAVACVSALIGLICSIASKNWLSASVNLCTLIAVV